MVLKSSSSPDERGLSPNNRLSQKDTKKASGVKLSLVVENKHVISIEKLI